MKTFRTITLFGFLCLLTATVCPSSYGQGWVVVNYSSQPNALPAMGEVQHLPKLAKVSSVTDGESIYPVAVAEGKVFIGCTLSPMSSKVLMPSVQPAPEDLIQSSQPGHLAFTGGGTRTEPGASYSLQGEASHWKTQFLENFLVPQPLEKSHTLDSPIDILFAPDEQVIRMESIGKWTLEGGKLEGTLSALLTAPCPAGQDATVAAAAAFHPFIAVKSSDLGWVVYRNGMGSNVQLRGENREYPDTESDIWPWFDTNGKGLGCWAFSVENDMATLRCYDLGGIEAGEMVKLPAEKDASFRLPGRGGGEHTLKPAFEIRDWSNQGIFVQGNLLAGGPLISSSVGSHGSVDLDNDGDTDVWLHGINDPVSSMLSSSAYKLDMQDDFHGFFVPYALKPGLFDMDTSFRYTEAVGRYTSMYSKTFLTGRTYKGAGRGFEEHILYKITGENQTPVKGPAAFFFKTTNDNIDRLTMGAFGMDESMYLAWNIEFDPFEAEEHPPASYRICEYEDPYGKKLRFTSCVYPEDWDGKALPLKEHEGLGVDFTPFSAWYRASKKDLFEYNGLIVSFSQEGDKVWSSEGMYGGRLSGGMRIERDYDKPGPFKVYYSSLFGGLHLYGAEFGYLGFDLNHKVPGLNELDAFYHKEAVDMPDGRWIGGREVHDLEGARLECPMYLVYLNNGEDEFQDQYMFDETNDGYFERTLKYDEKHQTALLREGSMAVAWPFVEKRVEVEYLIDNYNAIEELYLQGLEQAPLVCRAGFHEINMPMRREADTGHFTSAPEEKIENYIAAGPDWQRVIAMDTAHAGPADKGWKDFRDVGFTGLALHAQSAGFVPQNLSGPFSEDSLKKVDVLVLQQPMSVIADTEMVALAQWVQAGGTLVVTPADDNEESRLSLNGVLEPFGVQLANERLHVRSSIYKYGLQSADWNDQEAPIEEKRNPSPGQAIEHFSSEVPGLLKDFQFLTCVGYPLELSDAWKTVLAYQDKPVMAETRLGKGRILVSGVNSFANRYINHVQYIEPEADNTWLLGRIMNRIGGWHNRLEIAFEEANQATAFTISGKGGAIQFPKKMGASLEADGKKIEVRTLEKVREATLPPGQSRVRIY